MLSKIKRNIAQSLLICRPSVIPGTRAIIDETARRNWHTKVCETMKREKIVDQNDVKEFCDIAGVAD